MSTGPLQGFRVVEAASFAGGPSAAAVLADWGADVLKIEPPVGDRSRGIARNKAGLAHSPRFELHNRGKRSLAVDLRSPRGRELLHRLLGGADVLITNVRPRKLAGLGLDHAAVEAANPRIVYAQFTAYGVGHRHENRASTDHGAFWSASGLADLIGAGAAEPPQPAGGAGDRAAGLALAGAVCAALLRRERVGVGARVVVSLLATGTWLLGSDYSDVLRGGRRYGAFDRRSAPIPTLNCYQARDGKWLWLQLIDPERHWRRLVEALGLAELADPELLDAGNDELGRRNREVIALLDRAFRQRTRGEWEAVLDEHDLAHAPVLAVEDVVGSELAREAGLFVEAAPPPGRDVPPSPMLRSPVSFAGWDPDAVLAPEIGDATDAVLAELGCDAAAVARLRADGIVR